MPVNTTYNVALHVARDVSAKSPTYNVAQQETLLIEYTAWCLGTIYSCSTRVRVLRYGRSLIFITQGLSVVCSVGKPHPAQSDDGKVKHEIIYW